MGGTTRQQIFWDPITCGIKNWVIMSWLQSIVLIALAGFCAAYSTRRQNSLNLLYHNTFPYKQSMQQKYPDRDLISSAVVSRTSGPLCSGFHLQQNVVVTAASCVYREKAEDLVVISNMDVTKAEKSEEMLEYLPVKELKTHKDYNPDTDLHNVAVLVVENPTIPVPTVKFPSLMSSSGDDSSKSSAYFTKFVYVLPKNDFYSIKVPAAVLKDMSKCKAKKVPANSFFCVERSDGKAFSYGWRDVGTPLMYVVGNEPYLMGILTASNFDKNLKNYPYQSAYANMEFLRSFTDD